MNVKTKLQIHVEDIAWNKTVRFAFCRLLNIVARRVPIPIDVLGDEVINVACMHNMKEQCVGICIKGVCDTYYSNPEQCRIIKFMGDYSCLLCGASYGEMTKPKGNCSNCGYEEK